VSGGTGAELLFEVFSQRYERSAAVVTSNLPFDEWTSVFGSERLTGALLDRLTHHVHILELNGESYRLAQKTTARIAARSIIARCARSPSSPAPAARPYRASGLDRSARANAPSMPLTTQPDAPATVMHFYPGLLT
jgi:hypothetical protein